MKYLLNLIPLCAILSVHADEQTFQLGKELLGEQQYNLAAVEFRRFSMETENKSEQSASYLYAGYAYLQESDGRVAGEMLDRAEAAGLEAVEAHTLLSAETARLLYDSDSALYFYDTLSESDDAAFQTFARRRAAAINLQRGNLSDAQKELERSPSDETAALRALSEYTTGSDKSPLIGGLWGLIPGAGYWYSGETANGFRSLILNSLFMYGMYQTADDDQWGAFAIITFFEITWYSGSIYGGIDAAQRFNQDRMDTALHAIEGNMSYRPDPEIVVPLFKLNVHF